MFIYPENWIQPLPKLLVDTFWIPLYSLKRLGINVNQRKTTCRLHFPQSRQTKKKWDRPRSDCLSLPSVHFLKGQTVRNLPRKFEADKNIYSWWVCRDETWNWLSKMRLWTKIFVAQMLAPTFGYKSTSSSFVEESFTSDRHKKLWLSQQNSPNCPEPLL